MSPKGFTMACRSAVCAVIAIVAASQAIVAPVIIQANDTVGTGKTRISWTPSAGAAGYLVSAEPFSFSESFPRGSMTPGAWECAGPSCPNGVTTWSASTYPGNITLTMNGFANNCRSYLADCPSAEARLLHTAVFSVKSAFSISAFVDMSVGNNGIFQNNTAAGIAIYDATRGFNILYCTMITWDGFPNPNWALNGNTYRECKGYNDTNLVGAPGGFTISNRGRGAFRFDYNPSARTFTLFSGNTPGGPWHGTTQTLSLDALPNPPFVISNMRVGLWGRQWNPAANVAGGIKSLFSAISVTGGPAPIITTTAPASATTALITLPPCTTFQVRVAARFSNASWAAVSTYSTGVSVTPAVRVPFPFNTTYARWMGLTQRYDFTTEFNSPGLAQSDDYGPFGNWLQQKTSALRPAVQPFAQGELSALRMRGTAANPLGFMQTPFTGMSPTAQNNYWNLNYNVGQSVTVVVFTPGQQNPLIQPSGLGNVINKGLTSDAVPGFQVAQTGFNPGTVFHKFRGAGNSFPDSVTVASLQRTSVPTNAGPTVYVFASGWNAVPSGAAPNGCHMRYLYQWESGRPYITPTMFTSTGRTPPGPARLPNVWSFGGPGSDNDDQFRAGFEIAPCNYTGSCMPSPCVYDWSRQGNNGAAFTVGANSDGADAFLGDIFETFRFSTGDQTAATALWTATATQIMPYLQAKYYANCPAASNPSANATTPTAVAICTGPAAEGESCTTACTGAFGVPVFGTQTVTCAAGRWMAGTGGFSGPLVCSQSCPSLPAPLNAASCALVQTYDSFSAAIGAGAGTELHGYVQSPFAPDAYVRGSTGLWTIVDDGSGFGNNTVLAADTGDRAGLPATVSTVLLFQSSPVWTSTQTAASIAATGITVSALIRIQSAAGGGAGLVWAVAPTTGGALQYYQLVLTPTPDGLNVAGSFSLSFVINGTVTQMAAGPAPGLALSSWSTITVKWLGTSTLVSLDGVLIASGGQPANTVLPVGGVGVILTGGAAAQWDNLAITTSCSSAGGMGITGAYSQMVATWTCPAGYAALGSSTRTCGSGGWSGSAFSCNLMAPTFPSANYSLPESSAAGVVVATLNASTVASMLVTYAIASGNTGGAFALDACSGSLTVATPSMLVYAVTPVFTLLINALTNNDPTALTQGFVQVFLSKVAKPPVLVTTTVNIYVNATPGTPAFPLVTAFDDSGAATNFAISSSSGSTFSIVGAGNNSASLVLATAGALNYWTAPTMVVSVVLTSASNSSLTTVAALLVNVLYAPTAPTVPDNQLLTLPETSVIAVSEVSPAWTNPIAATSINVQPVVFTYTTLAVYGGPMTDGSGPLLLGAANPIVVNVSTGSLGFTTPLIVTDASKQFAVGLYITRAAYTVGVLVTDNTGYSAAANVTLLILLANSATNVALLTQVSPSTGLDTLGGSIITLTGTAFDGLVNLSARVVYGPYNATNCAPNAAVGAPLTPGYQPASITCLAVPGSGAGWPLTLFVGGVKLQAASVLRVSYAPPEVSDVSATQPGILSPPPTSVMPGQLSTQGGELFYLTGAHLGQSAEVPNITVAYGPPSNPMAFIAAVVDAGDSWLLVRSSVGFGTSLTVTVTVTGQSALSTSTGLAYGPPLVTSISGLAPTDDPAALPTEGGTSLVFRGLNFGPALLFGVDVTAAVTVVYGYSLADPSSLVYTAVGCVKSVTSPHTTISCTTVGGVGSGLVATISVSDVIGSVAASNLTLLSYVPPTVTRIYGAGATNANTAGGGIIAVEGTGFGPAVLNGAATLAAGTPGWQRGSGGLTYGSRAAVGCAVQSPTLLTCTSAQGTGAGYSWMLSIAGQSVFFNETLMSYGAPVIYTLTGVGAASRTEGGVPVLITGQNLGANASLVSAFYTSSFVKTDSALGVRSVQYNTTSCSITIPDTQLSCMTAPGAGAALTWGLSVDGLASVTPVTAYLPPYLSAVANASGGPAAGVVSGDTLILSGGNFAPSPASGAQEVGPRGYVDWLTYGPSGVEYVVLNWTVLSHSSLSFIVPPGFGAGLTLRLSVGGQLAAFAADVTLSYALPSVVSVSPRSWTTQGGLVMTLQGSSFSISDPTASFGILLGNPSDKTVTPLLSLLSASENSGTGLGTVTFSLPPGVGANRAVRFAVYRSSLGPNPPITSLVLSNPLADTPAYPSGGPDLGPAASSSSAGSFFSYQPPSLAQVSVSVASTPAQVSYLTSTLGCPPSSTSCGPYYLLELTGSDFGADPTTSGSIDTVVRAVDFADFYTGALLPPPSTQPIFSWEPTKIVVFSTLLQANVRVRIGSESWTGSIQNISTDWMPYQSLAPSVAALSGQVSGIPTAGTLWPTVGVAQVKYMQSATAIRVTVGGVNAVIVDPTNGNALDPVTAVPVVRSTLTPEGIVSISFNIPPGQGTSNALQVLRMEGGVWLQSSGSDGWFVSYAPPSLTQAGIQAVDATGSPIPGSFSMQPVSATLNLVAPSDGSLLMRIAGTNLGVCPTVTVGFAQVLLCPDARRNLTATPGAVLDANGLTFPVPRGEGAGFSVVVVAGDQNTASQAWSLSYAPAVVTWTAAADVTAGTPTSGGTRIFLSGRGFGTHIAGSPTAWGWDSNAIASSVTSRWVRSLDDPMPPLVDIGPLVISSAPGSPAVLGWAPCKNVIRINDTAMTCMAPEGDGASLQLRVTVGNSPAIISAAGSFAYDAPSVLSVECSGVGCGAWGNATAATALWTPSSNATVQGVATGGYNLTLRGINFGVASALPDASAPRYCVFLPWRYRPGASLNVPSCNGLEDFLGEGELPSLAIVSRSHTSLSFVVPAGLGTHTIALSIAGNYLRDGLGSATTPTFMYNPPSIMSVVPAHGPTDGGAQVTIRGTGFGVSPLNTSAVSPRVVFPVSLAVAATLPTVLLRVNVHRGCVTDGYMIDGSVPSSVSTCAAWTCTAATCQTSVVSRTDASLMVLSAPGIGTNRLVTVTLIEGFDSSAPIITSNAMRWDFDPPTIALTLPDVMLVQDAAHTSPLALALKVSGTNFGTQASADRDGWTPEEKFVSLMVDSIPCTDGATRGLQGSLPIIQCNIPLITVGPHNVSIGVAGQNTTLLSTDPNAFVVACGANYYGAPGQYCLPCPLGASCAGFSRLNNTLNFIEPVPLAGFFNLNGSMSDACPAAISISGRASCIVPCVPADACLGDNTCAAGYISTAPYYRCASCAPNYYHLGTTCAQCPSNPYLLIAGVALVFIVIAAIGYILNSYGVNVGYISIGIDWAQVVAIFASAGVKWPPAVLQLLQILSAFNLNIEIVAPECLVPSVSFKQKFAVVMMLPIVVGLAFAIVGSCNIGYKRFILGRSKNLTRHLGSLISALMLIAYFLYIYITRLLLDVFNCTPTDPPDGKLYLQVVFEECGVPGGTQMTLMPWAVLGLVFYTLGYPAFLAQLLWRNREIIMTDQILRAKGSGLDRLTNPVAYDFRRRYGRSYYQFRPDYAYFWILFIFLRKLGIASVGVIFNRNVAFQMAAALLVVFFAYAIQVRCVPYMGPGDFEDVLTSHAASALTDARHARIRATLANIATAGRKRMRRNLLDATGKVDRKAVLSVLGSYLFNYNTVESTLLFSAIMVSLMGLMYTAQASGSAYYSQAQTVITAVLMLDIIGTIIYFFTVLFVEVYLMLTEASRAREMAAALKAGSKRPSFRSARSLQSSPMTGPLDSSVNPLFLSADGGGAALNPLSGGGQAARDAVLSLKTPPPPELWTVFQSQFVTATEQVESLAAQVSSLKAQQQKDDMLRGPADGLELSQWRSRAASRQTASRMQFAQVAITSPGSSPLVAARNPSGSFSSAGTRSRDDSGASLLPQSRLGRAGSVRGRKSSGATLPNDSGNPQSPS